MCDIVRRSIRFVANVISSTRRRKTFKRNSNPGLDKEDGFHDRIESLVCKDCWKGPFAQDTFRRFVAGETFVYKTTWSRIQASADSGCALCQLLIPDKESDRDDVVIRLRFGKADFQSSSVQPVTPHGAQFMEIEIEDYEIEISNNAHFFYVSSADPAAVEIIARDPIRDVSSDKAYSLAEISLHNCITNHPGCPKVGEHTLLPTRVLDCLDPTCPRLFSAQDTYAPYVALSYVWGGEQPNFTTTTNLATYTSRIDVELIPKTIRDAIQATHRFGIRYLWVDSFCIIQDSKEDKKVQLLQLRRIFRDAYFTLIASSAPTSFSGFLQDRAEPSTPPPRLPYWCQDGRLGTVCTWPMFSPYDGTGEPVNQRAWCLEERLLSARKLVYASDTLQYHCQSTVTYIGDALAVPRTAERLPDVMFVPRENLRAYTAGWNAKQWRDVRWVWADAVINYTKRAVTKPRDKLTALAGVAEQFHRVWHPDPERTDVAEYSHGLYLAGLWKRTLVLDLLWSKDPQTPLRPRPSVYLAPSWSWASVDGTLTLTEIMDTRIDPAVYAHPERIKTCEILECSATLEDERLLHGRVTGGLLKLRTHLVPITWNPTAKMSEHRLLMKREDTSAEIFMVETNFEEVIPEEDPTQMHVGVARVDAVEEVLGLVWACILIWNSDDGDDAHSGGILLTYADEGVYRRVGYWEADPELQQDARILLTRFISTALDTIVDVI